MAARCGSLDAVSCLISNYANILATDQTGWAPIHHAAFFDHEPVIKLMVRKNPGQVELPTKNDLRSTPLLLAASSGALAAVKCLINLKADVTKQDSDGNNLVVLAALRFHTNVLEYLIQWGNPNVPVWQILVQMLTSDSLAKQDSAVKCLEVLSTSKPDHWRSITEAGGVSALVGLLSLENEEIQSVAASVLCNISEHDEIRLALTAAKAGPILIKLLSSPVDDIQSRAAIILSDIACIEGNQDMVAEAGGIQPLIALLESELEDVLVNAVNAVRVLCINNKTNQSAVAQYGGLEPLVEFLTVNSEILQAATAAAIASVVRGHKENQDAVINEGAAKALVDLIKGSRNITVQVKAASAIEYLAHKNINAQRVFLDLDAPKSLLRLLKNINVEVREQGACSLWALAGHTNTQQKYIAERMGIPHIIQMLLEPTEKLLTVGCMTAIALGRENTENQNKLAAADAFQQLVRLLRSHKTPDTVVLMVIKVLGILCVGVAYRNNKVTQRKILEEGGIPILVQLLLMPPNTDVQVEVAITLACVVLGNRTNQEKLSEEPGFRHDILLDLLHSHKEETRLKAGMALAIFAFNNTPQQFLIRQAGGIKFSAFVPYLESSNEYHECKAAFQIVVLARVIKDMDQVTLTAQGITQLVAKLRSEEPNVVMLAASLLSSLAHTRAGIPDAMITTGAIDLLIMHLYSNTEQVRHAVAVALGYLTFNKTASRLLLSACRNTPDLYKKLMDNLGADARICQDFLDDFRHAKIVGLPKQQVQLHAKPASPRADRQRPKTTLVGWRSTRMTNRAVSAPAGGRSAPRTTVVLDQSEDEDVEQSIGSLRPVSTSSQLSGKPSTSDSSFKTQLSSWKAK